MSVTHTTPSLLRVISNIKQVGLKNAWAQMNAIGDIKAGTFMGQDEHGNRYFENPSETLWRHRYVEYASNDPNASQVPPEWHSWIGHIRLLPPNQDPAMIEARQPWQTAHFENVTGTRGAYKPYSTVKPKISAWVPTIAARK